jgi:dynein heavy chain
VCAQELHEAVATYDGALAEVSLLVPKDDLAELRSFNRPPGLVQVVMEAVCILMGVNPQWDAALSLLQDKNFLGKIASFRHDRVSDATLRRLQSYVRNKGFVPEAVQQVSKAAKSLCVWVLAVDHYGKVRFTAQVWAEVSPGMFSRPRMNHHT